MREDAVREEVSDLMSAGFGFESPCLLDLLVSWFSPLGFCSVLPLDFASTHLRYLQVDGVSVTAVSLVLSVWCQPRYHHQSA